MNTTFLKFLSLSVLFTCISCRLSTTTNPTKVSIVKDKNELYEALKNTSPGDEIVMANGIWENVQIRLKNSGEEGNPITLRAETAGEVFIEGVSDLKFGSKYVVVNGLYFRNGYTPSNAVIDFKITKDSVANFSIDAILKIIMKL